MRHLSQKPLSDAELDQLGAFLASMGGNAMSLEMLDGFFTALICSPDMTMPSEYMPEILGENFSFETMKEAEAFLGLVMRHWNAISGNLRRTLGDNENIHHPLLDGKNPVCGNDWATGFMRGTSFSPGWEEVLQDEEKAGMLFPMMYFAHERDPDPELRPEPPSPEKREEVLLLMIAGAMRAYRHFEPHRTSPRLTPSRVVKTGRNDPCPCNSGKKYKHCCLPTLH